jgi:pyruvate carboxylase
LIDTTPELFASGRDRATKLLTFLGDVTVAIRRPRATSSRSAAARAHPGVDHKKTRRPARVSCCSNRCEEIADWMLRQRLLITDTTFRDAHQSLFATRLRTYDMFAVADAPRGARRNCLVWNVGRRHR